MIQEALRQAWSGISDDFHGMHDLHALTRLAMRLLVAAILGGLLGFDRERKGKGAGLRTYMLVSLGCALFLVLIQYPGHTTDDISRVVQGIAAGIGFLGAGAIIKLQGEHEIHGLTTAAGIWFAAAVGATAGTGQLATAVWGTILAWIILAALRPIETWIHSKSDPPAAAGENPNAHERG